MQSKFDVAVENNSYSRWAGANASDLLQIDIFCTNILAYENVLIL